MLKEPSAPATVAVVVPLSGSLGLCGPSALNCARLAGREINARDGLLGRPVELLVVDGGREPAAVGAEVGALARAGVVDAVVGMHTSDARVAVTRVLRGRIPYVYTPPYEGGERSTGLFLAGETPEHQLAPVLGWLGEHRRVRSWYLVGNDYVWPRRTHRAARAYARAAGQVVLGESYVPLGTDDFERVIGRVSASRADAVLMSLVGSDLVAFNRQLRERGLGERLVRLSASLEENGLLGMDGDDSGNLFAAMGYFGSLVSEDSLGFVERYVTAFGPEAPVLNAHGQSTYEGMLLLESLARAGGTLDVRALEATRTPVSVIGARGPRRLVGRHLTQPVYLARADGLDFEVLGSF